MVSPGSPAIPYRNPALIMLTGSRRTSRNIWTSQVPKRKLILKLLALRKRCSQTFIANMIPNIIFSWRKKIHLCASTKKLVPWRTSDQGGPRDSRALNWLVHDCAPHTEALVVVDVCRPQNDTQALNVLRLVSSCWASHVARFRKLWWCR